MTVESVVGTLTSCWRAPLSDHFSKTYVVPFFTKLVSALIVTL